MPTQKPGKEKSPRWHGQRRGDSGCQSPEEFECAACRRYTGLGSVGRSSRMEPTSRICERLSITPVRQSPSPLRLGAFVHTTRRSILEEDQSRCRDRTDHYSLAKQIANSIGLEEPSDRC